MIIKNQVIPVYGIMILLSLVIGLLYILISLKKEGIRNKNVYLFILLYLIFTMMFGLKIYISQNAENRYIIQGGLYSYGGAIGVILAAVVFEKILPTNNKIVKYAIISLPLTYAISKLGCFHAGCCYGIPYEGPLSVTYIDKMQFSVFPVQMLETIVFFIIFVICNYLNKNKNAIYITIILSALAKFLLDYLRYEHIGKTLTINQGYSIVLIVVAIGIFVFNKIKEKKHDL